MAKEYEPMNKDLNPPVTDWAQERYESVLRAAKFILTNTALTDPEREITEDDLIKINIYHEYASPVNQDNHWKLRASDNIIPRSGIRDGSTYGNWESNGGPLEHINLAMKAGDRVTRLLQENLRNSDELTDQWAIDAVSQLRNANPLAVAAAMGLHDEGREVTHTYLVNDLVGNQILREVGVREDLLEIMPDESVMLTPREESMDETIQSLNPLAVAVRIADEFGKRAPGTKRTYQPEDYNAWDRNKWAEGYISRPLTGIEQDEWMRGQMQLHVDNVPDYFAALDNWIRSVSNLTLKDITEALSDDLSPLLE